MPATPKMAGRTARPGARFLADALGENLRGLRAIRGLSQEDLAARMVALRHDWIRATVSNVERGRRSVSVDELLGLAVSLAVTMGELLDPTGIRGDRGEGLDLGTGEPLDPEKARFLVHQWASVGLIWDAAQRPTGWTFGPAPDAPHPLEILRGAIPRREPAAGWQPTVPNIQRSQADASRTEDDS
jgi:transcriptional regulator with XRE-family HTH domain